MSLGNRIVTARLKKGMSQWDLALKTGIHQTTLSRFENGSRRPGYSQIKKLAEVLDVSSDYILGMEVKKCSIEKKF